MNELEKYLEKLQNADHHTKNMIMWIGAPLVMALVVFIWLGYSDFGVKEEPVEAETQEKTSNFEIFKNGLSATIQELQSMIGNAREKIFQTNNLNFEAPEEIIQNNVSTATALIATTTTATTTINN